MSEAAAEATTETTAAGTAAQGTETTATETKAAEGTAAEPKTVEELPAWAQKAIADARKEAGEERVASKRLTELQKLLNPDAKGDEKPDAASLTKALSSKDDTIRELTVKLSLKDALEANGANKLTEAVLAGEGKLKDLDPTADDFQAKLSAVVKDAVKRHPQLQAVQAATTSGANFGGSGESTNNANKARPGQARIAAAYASK